jgi:hypothetical protein
MATAIFRRRGTNVKHLAKGPLAGQVRYYDLKRRWSRRIVPHLDDPELNHILVREFNKFTMGTWGRPFLPGMLPEDVESCDWRCDHRPPHPKYWAYVKHAACHWIVNFSLRLANLAEPKHQWRILTSQDHSTVWDGELTLFDFNFQALGIPVKQTFLAACRTELPVGAYLTTYFASDWDAKDR